jgi:hypothetical protein
LDYIVLVFFCFIVIPLVYLCLPFFFPTNFISFSLFYISVCVCVCIYIIDLVDVDHVRSGYQDRPLLNCGGGGTCGTCMVEVSFS